MTDTDRLAALLHNADIGCAADRRLCDPKRGSYSPHREDAPRLIAQGVRVGDDGLRALRYDFESLRTTAREQAILDQGKRIADHFTGQVYAYDEVLRRIDTALAAQPTPPALDRERLARALRRVRVPGSEFNDAWAEAIADAYEADQRRANEGRAIEESQR